MTKRIFAMFLVLALVISMAPAVVLAEGADTVVKTPKAGTHTDAGHADDCGETSGWQAWESDNSLPNAGKYYLTKDVTLSAEYTATADLTLCLNGFVIKQTADKRILGTPKSNLKATVTICDCTAYEENGVYYAGALTGGKMTGQDGGAAIFVRPNTTLKIYDGRFVGNTYQNDNETTGGAAIMVRSATGGYHGEVYIHGGEFSQNHSYKANGTTANIGGAITFGNGAVFEIHNAAFKENTAKNGGAIYAGSGTGVITNTTFTGNRATFSGSAIHVNSGLQLTIGDGTVITGNTGTNTDAADGLSAAVVMGSKSNKLTLSGKVIIAGNTTGATGVASLTLNKTDSDVLYVNALAAGSCVEFCTPKTVPAEAGEVVAVNGTQTDWSSGWVSHMGVDGALRYVGKDSSGFTFAQVHIHTQCADTGCTDHADRVVYEPWGDDESEKGKLPSSGNWYLVDDVTVTSEVKIEEQTTLNLCLNGKTVTGFAGTNGRAYSTTADIKTTINISDCSAALVDGVYKAGKFTGFTNKSTGSGGAVIFIRAGSELNFFDGIITGNTTLTGGTVYIKNSTFHMWNGEISNNIAQNGTAKKNGAGIYLDNAAMTLHDGKISGNQADQGGGIYMANSSLIMKKGTIENNKANWGAGIAFSNGNSSVDLRGGSITGNIAASNGGAIQCAYSAATVKLSGKLDISGNKLESGVANNIRLGNSGYITVGNLSAGSKIGITAGADRVISANTLSSDLSSYFASDDDTQVVFLNADKKLQLQDKPAEPQPPVSDHKHTLCGDTGCTEHTEEIAYAAWTDATKLPDSGNWYLATDVHVTDQTTLSTAVTVNLCLNGHKITGDSGSNNQAYSTANLAGATVNISNCSETGGSIEGMENTATGTGGGALCNRPGNTMRVFHVTFKNNKSACAGGAIFSAGTVYVYDCAFIGNEAVNGKDGGAIFNNRVAVDGVNYAGKLYIYNTTFTGNKARNGAGVNGTAQSTAHLENVTFDGNISSKSDNTAEGGAYRAVTATTTMKNVKMVNNQANVGSAVCIYGGSFTAENLEITGNHTTHGFGAFHMNRNDAGATPVTVTLKGKVIIDGNTYGTDNVAQNLYMREFEAYVDATGLTEGSKLGVSMNSKRIANGYLNITTGQNGVNNAAYFSSDDAAWSIGMGQEVYLKPAFEHIHCVCGKADCTDTAHQKIEYNAWTDKTALPNTGNYCLTTDVTITKEASVTGTLNLCLHGHKVTGGEGKGLRFFSTPGTGGEVLNITDCTAKWEGDVYTAGGFYDNTNTHTASGGGAIFIRKGGHLNFYEGIVSGNVSATGGAAFYVKDSTANFYGGLVKNNKATFDGKWYNGGAIYNDNAVATAIYGTVFTGNEAGYGGVIYNGGTSRLELCGGSMTGNIAHINGGGINAIATAGSVKISGAPVIMGNKLESGKANNIRLGGTGIMDVTDLGEKAQIGITADVFRAISTQTQDYTDNFISDDPKLNIIYQENVLYMGANGDHKHCLCLGSAQQGCDHSQLTFVEWDDPTNVPTSGNYCLTVDVVVSAQARLENATLNLCLNGHTIKVGDQGGRVYYMTNGGKLNITDCAGGGKISGATAGAVLTNSAGTDMEVNLFAGSFTDNHSQASGGAVVIQGDCTFNMYGGSITGNSATSYLKTDGDGKVILDANGNETYYASNGGGLYLANGVFNMYGGEISGNKAVEIGYKKAGATAATMVGGHGGAMQITYGATANFYGGKVSDNTAFNGGGIFATGEGVVVNLLGTEVSGNKAGNGGGVLTQTHAQLNMKGGKVSGNIATISGGGIYVSTGTTMVMTGGEVVGNHAAEGKTEKNGGGIFVLSSTLELAGGKIHGNKAANGAGIYSSAVMSGDKPRAATINIKDGALITDNHASANGGAIMMCGRGEMTTGEGSKIIMTGGEISKNTAKNAAGILTQTKAAMEFSGGKITGNSARDGGGGLYISTGTKLTMTGGSITGNSATNGGGGLFLLRSTAVIKGGSISYNIAGNGGGIKNNGAKLDIYSLSVVGNDAVGTTSAAGKYTAGNAGGLWAGRAGYKKNGVQMYDTPVINIYNIYLADSTATGAAGGILIQSQGTIFNMQGGTITGNATETNSGGGLYLSSNVTANITGGIFTKNVAKNGAAIYIGNNNAKISGIQVYENHALNSATITVTGKTTTDAVLKDSQVYNNVADGHVGALVIQGYAYMTVENTKIYGNKCGGTGGAVYFSNPGYGTLKNVEIYENEAAKQAGAIFLGGHSAAELDNVTIRDNVAGNGYGGGIYNRGRVVIKNSKILNNYVKDGVGGGIACYKVNSMLLGTDAGAFVENTVISGNKADNQGGGVYGNRGGPIYLTDCVVTENTAALEGGAIYADGKMGLENVTVTGNTSGGEGFAIYLTSSEFDGHSYQTGHKRIAGEMVVKDNQGGDLYLSAGTILAVTGEKLGENSYVSLTLCEGVLSQWVFGVYHYEGGNHIYVLTSGDRSITDPEPIPAAETEPVPQETTEETSGNETAQQPAEDNTLLYVGIGGIAALLIAAAAIVIGVKKKKAGSAAKE